MTDRLCAAVGNQGATLLLIGGAPCALFVAVGLVQTAIELLAPHASLVSYKLQPRAARLTPKELREVWAVATVSWLISLALAAAEAWWVLPAIGAPPLCNSPMPTWRTVVRDLAVFLAVEEVLFYYVHFALHEVQYAAVHKIHHRFTAPISVAAVYAHPLEHVIANVLPAAAGPLLMCSHPLTTAGWTLLVVASTMHAHSGLNVPLLSLVSDAAAHDWHHETFRDCYGPLGFLDWLHGTSRAARAARAARARRAEDARKR